METQEKKNTDLQRLLEVYGKITESIPQGTSMLDIIRVGEFLIADAIRQSNADEKVREETYNGVVKDIRNIVGTMEKVGEESKE